MIYRVDRDMSGVCWMYFHNETKDHQTVQTYRGDSRAPGPLFPSSSLDAPRQRGHVVHRLPPGPHKARQRNRPATGAPGGRTGTATTSALVAERRTGTIPAACGAETAGFVPAGSFRGGSGGGGGGSVATAGWRLLSGGVTTGEGSCFGQHFEAFLAGLVADRHAQRAVAEFLEVKVHAPSRRCVVNHVGVHGSIHIVATGGNVFSENYGPDT